MLSPELKKLKDYLSGVNNDIDIENIDNTKLLNELEKLDEIKIPSSEIKKLNESLAVASKKCPTCGHTL